MSDSNPRSGDWDNTMRGWIVFAGLVIIGSFLTVLAVTGHVVAAFYLFIAVCLIALVAWGLWAGRHERDH